MTSIDTVVVGAGHAGLAVSRLLTDAGRDHVVLDRGRVAERWRSERWDSLHLLTPNWMTRLPGWCYTGPDPDGYLSSAQLINHLERYAASFQAPVIPQTTVVEIAAAHGPALARFRVVTDTGTWHARHVVVATGPHGRPHLPRGLSGISGRVEVVTANSYRNPAAFPSGGVLVVGASASGVQIADELSRAGREVSLAVGRHTRMLRRYRGMDSFWWLEATGRLARTIDDMPDVAAARRENSLQLVGRPDPCLRGRDLDLGVLQTRGVRLLGRLKEVAGTVASFSSDLEETIAEADRRMHHFLDAVDRYVEDAGLTQEVLPPCDHARSRRWTRPRDSTWPLRTSELCSSRLAIAPITHGCICRSWLRMARSVSGVVSPPSRVCMSLVSTSSIAATRASSTALGTTHATSSIICWVVGRSLIPSRRNDGWLHDPV